MRVFLNLRGLPEGGSRDDVCIASGASQEVEEISDVEQACDVCWLSNMCTGASASERKLYHAVPCVLQNV